VVTFAGRAIERDLRKRGWIGAEERVVEALAAELISAQDADASNVIEDEHLSVLGLRLPPGAPVGFAFTERDVFVRPSKRIEGWRAGIVHIAGVRRDANDAIELVFVADPPRRYCLRLGDTSIAATVVKELSALREDRLAEQDIGARALLTFQYGDAFRRLGEFQRAGEYYKQIADEGSVPQASDAALNYGLICRRSHDYETAKRYLLQAKNGGRIEISARAAASLAPLHVRERDLHGARQYFEEARSFGSTTAQEGLEWLDGLERLSEDELRAVLDEISER